MNFCKNIRKKFAMGLIVGGLILAAVGICSAQGKIAFASSRDGNFEIYVMNADGTNQTRLTNDGGEDIYPSLSPDGSKIVFHSDRTGAREIYVMDVDGANQTRLTDTTGDNAFATFSPDGSKIVFTSSRTGDLEIFVMDANGSNQVRLTNITGADRDPSFSPDGSKIVFESYRSGFCGEIFVMNANGTSPVKLTDSNAGQFCDRRPYFNPDGNKRTFNADREFGSEIYVMDANGANATRLTDTPTGKASYFSSFSPDGSKIVFASDRETDSEIYVMNSDGSSQMRLTISAGGDILPSWGVQSNTPPTISATAQSVPRDSTGSHSIASVGDAEDDEDDLSVTVNGGTSSAINGITVSGISVAANGTVSATITTTCSSANASFTLRVTDSESEFAEATLNVTVTAEDEDPVLDLPDDIVVSLAPNSSDVTKIVTFTVSATDNCDAAPSVVATPASGSAFSIGTTTVNVVATDASGNTAEGSFTITVLYNFAGFYQPVDNLPVVNIVAAGQSVPLKFSLSGYKGLNIFAAGSPTSQMVPCTGGSSTSPIEETVTAGSSSLTYDPTVDRYQYVWKTQKTWRGTCRLLIMTLNDGSTHTALFQFN